MQQQEWHSTGTLIQPAVNKQRTHELKDSSRNICIALNSPEQAVVSVKVKMYFNYSLQEQLREGMLIRKPWIGF
jgi:hypothetical protein